MSQEVNWIDGCRLDTEPKLLTNDELRAVLREEVAEGEAEGHEPPAAVVQVRPCPLLLSRTFNSLILSETCRGKISAGLCAAKWWRETSDYRRSQWCPVAAP